jgi:hypothetical protein
LDWIWLAGSGEDFFFNFSVFLLFCYYLLLERGNPLHLNKRKSNFPTDDLCQVWLKLALWFWRRSRKCKSLQTDGKTDGRWTTDDQNSSLELRWAKKDVNENTGFLSFVFRPNGKFQESMTIWIFWKKNACTKANVICILVINTHVKSFVPIT